MAIALLTSRRYLISAFLLALVAAVLTGVPTDVLPNPWFTRMTPVRALDLIVWPLSSIAIGGLVATYVPRPRNERGQSELEAPTMDLAEGSARPGGSTLLGGLFSVFAIGCPVCNKLVVLALGLTGALTYFAPLQPLLGAIAVALPLWALRRRLRALDASCAVAAPAQAAAVS